MPNDVIQYSAVLNPTPTGVVLVIPVPILVPEGLGLWVRAIEFRWSGVQAGDFEAFAGVSLVAEQPALPSTAALLAHTKFMAFDALASEFSTSGETLARTTRRVDVSDLRYVLVMRPTLQAVNVGNTFMTIVAVVFGELVGVSEGQRNAIIATQGGAK